MEKAHIIDKIEPGSIAEELELTPGDVLLAINDQEIGDIFDYHFLIHDEELTVLVRKPDGEEWELEIVKDYDEDLGIVFENGLMDDYKSCRNKCIFCFIDQMPKGMRDTLYFKDDDTRLSFLQGNYVTLTNLGDADIDRIIRYHLEPINVSVQTMNPDLRCKMLHNRFAGEALLKMRRLRDAGITMNGQIVLCKGINDGEELEYSIRKLTEYIPCMQSVSVVPVGLTKYREGLYPLVPFTKEGAEEVIAVIHKWQQYCMEHYGIHFVHAGDEWYYLAKQPMPEEETYDGYLQLENGVGMVRLLEEEFMEALAQEAADSKRHRLATSAEGMAELWGHRLATSAEGMAELQGHRLATLAEGMAKLRRRRMITIATGRLTAPLLETLGQSFMEKFPDITVQVIPIRNDFFGEMITVSGLLTGQDLAAQLKGRDLGDKLLLPCNLLRSGEEVFLDDMTLTELKNALQVQIDIVKSSGQDLVNALLEKE